jgi:hypothetical protein
MTSAHQSPPRAGKLALAERCLQQSGDMSGQMLMHSATGNHAGMEVRAGSLRRSTLQLPCNPHAVHLRPDA